VTNQIFKKAYWRFLDHLAQWLWFILRIDPDCIGYDNGLLTWKKQRKHKALQRKIHICLLDVFPPGGKFGQFVTFWINERSSLCRATVNEGIENADVIWIYSQDPLPPNIQKELLELIKKAKDRTPIINHPDVYNSYHKDSTFKLLDRAGISVPRLAFTAQDIGKTNVISAYKGTLDGFRAFEFVDSRDSNVLYKKYRAIYIAGFIFPDRILFSNQWDVNAATIKHVEYAFKMTSVEIDSISLIAKLLKIQFFAIDYLRRSSDNLPIFIDINLYPFLMEYIGVTHQVGCYSRLIRWDTRLRLWIKEPSEKDCWYLFDRAMTTLVNDRSDN
jgi:hypothetical protein